MRVAILTLFATGNMGALLQAFATQKLVKQAGHESDLIYFRDEFLENPINLKNLKRKGIRGYIGAIVGAILRMPCKKNMWSFIRKHVNITSHVSRREMENMVSQYDFFLAGSDCIWNSDAMAFEKSYLLDFVPTYKKGNYSSSFATNVIKKEYRAEYAKYLSQFQSLSVRENQGKKIIYDLTGKESTVVLDPTLTLASSFWKKISSESKLDLHEPYIFIAEYAVSPHLIREAKKLAEITGLPLYLLYPAKGGRLKGRLFISAGPEDFLALIQNASFVLTDSYHVSIFSINFGIPFWTYLTETNLPTISKYDTVFGKLGLMCRIRKDATQAFDLLSQEKINYDAVYEKLEQERVVSKRFLQNILDQREKVKNK